MELAACGGMEPQQRAKDDPRRSTAAGVPRWDPRAGAGPTPTCWSALLWPRRSPRRAWLARRPRSPRLKKQETQKVSQLGGLRKVEARSPCLQTRGLDGVASRLAATTRGPSLVGPPTPTPHGLRGVPHRGSGPPDPEGKELLPVSRPYRKGREGSLGPSQDGMPPGAPKLQRALGALGFALFIFLIGGRGHADSLWCILIPGNLDSGCPAKGPLEVPRPTQCRPTRLGDK